ncbi:hypothetical protein ACWC4A_52580 [Streptomyces mirabilis]
MTAQPLPRADSFSALSDCFSVDLAALIGEEPRNVTPTGFIDLVKRVRDVLGTTGDARLQEAHEDLNEAVTHLTDALTSSENDQRSLLAWACTYLRDAIETAR